MNPVFVCRMSAMLSYTGGPGGNNASLQGTTVGASKPLHRFIRGQPKIIGVRQTRTHTLTHTQIIFQEVILFSCLTNLVTMSHQQCFYWSINIVFDFLLDHCAGLRRLLCLLFGCNHGIEWTWSTHVAKHLIWIHTGSTGLWLKVNINQWIVAACSLWNLFSHLFSS